MPTNTFQFETCDVQFWKNDSKGAQQQGRATAAHATWQNGTSVDPPAKVSSGQYSVSQARGNEHLTGVQQEIKRTFYTVVTKPQRLLDEYESQEVYQPSRSVSQDPEAARRRDSTVRVSVRSEGAANGNIRMANTMDGASLTLPRVKTHTIRSTDTVPIVRVNPGARRPPSRVETSHVVTGSLSRKLNDISGRSVVRDSQSGQTMAARAGSQPPGKVTYQYKVDASERRIEYRYHSETLLYDFEETTKREQLETWQSQQRAPANGAVVTTIRKTKSLQEAADPLQSTPDFLFFGLFGNGKTGK